MIVAHLGSGASMCALANGASVESTMGFTALDGLPMGTRPGQLDPGVVLYLMTEKGMSADAVQKMLYAECGLKGLSGISNDVRELLRQHRPGARLAMDHFHVSRRALRRHAGGSDSADSTRSSLRPVLARGLPRSRAEIASRLAWLGAELDPAANAAGKTCISKNGSRVALYVVPTDEELMIAKHTLAVLSAAGRLPHSD